MSSVMGGLEGLIERAEANDTTDRSLLVVNRTQPGPERVTAIDTYVGREF